MRTALIGLLVLLTGIPSHAQQPSWPPWYQDPIDKQLAEGSITTNEYKLMNVKRQEIDIPAEDVDLLLDTLAEEEPSKSWPEPSRTLVLGLRNTGRKERTAYEYNANLFPFGTLCCESPEGWVAKRKIPPVSGWRGRPPEPELVKRGISFFYPNGHKREIYSKSLTEWFGPLEKEGLYYVWWEYKGKHSNYLVFERKRISLTPVP
jgi:hypothetical protein